MQSAQIDQNPDLRDRKTRFVVFRLDRHFRSTTSRPPGSVAKIKCSVGRVCCLCCIKLKGSYLVIAYLLCKLAYLSNAVGQLYLLDVFLGTDYHFYGIDVMRRLLDGDDWTESVRFPRVTLCNFDVRRQTKVHTHIVQCALPINLFNEKLFIFIWFWFVMLAIVTSYNFLWWTYQSFNLANHKGFVRSRISLCNEELVRRQKQNLNKFVRYHVQRDGIFILRLLALNAGNLAAAEVCTGLWENYGPCAAHAYSVQREAREKMERELLTLQDREEI